MICYQWGNQHISLAAEECPTAARKGSFRWPSNRTASIFSFNARANLPQAIDQIRDEDLDRLVELNLTSCMALTRALVPGMGERRCTRSRGSIRLGEDDSL
ncbi:MAG: hypothetical protein ABSG53_11735, partial [Thermoguttaceae bacterium]